MKKTLFALAILAGGLFTVNQAKAQMVPGSELSIGVSPMLPVSEGFKDAYSFGLGGDLQYGYNFDESIGLTLSAGYNNFFPKKEYKDLGAESLGIIPIKAGVKYGISSFYIHPQLGVAIGTNEGAGSSFTYGGGIGTNLAGFDLSLRYEGFKHKNADKSDGFIGLRIGYALPLGR